MTKVFINEMTVNGCLLNTFKSNIFLVISFGFSYRGIGAVVYRVPQLENDQMLKISLRSLDREDTTPISQV